MQFDTPQEELAKTRRYLALLIAKRLTRVTTGNGNYVVITYKAIRHVTDRAALIDTIWFPLSVLAYNDSGDLLAKKWFLEKAGQNYESGSGSSHKQN